MKRALVGVLIATACCGPKGGGANNPRPDLTIEAVISELATIPTETRSRSTRDRESRAAVTNVVRWANEPALPSKMACGRSALCDL